MWKPDKPVLIAGEALTDREAWWHDFSGEFHALCGGEVDGEWLTGLAAALYPLNEHRAPREAAKVAFATLSYELPGAQLPEPITPPSPHR